MSWQVNIAPRQASSLGWMRDQGFCGRRRPNGVRSRSAAHRRTAITVQAYNSCGNDAFLTINSVSIDRGGAEPSCGLPGYWSIAPSTDDDAGASTALWRAPAARAIIAPCSTITTPCWATAPHLCAHTYTRVLTPTHSALSLGVSQNGPRRRVS